MINEADNAAHNPPLTTNNENGTQCRNPLLIRITSGRTDCAARSIADLNRSSFTLRPKSEKTIKIPYIK